MIRSSLKAALFLALTLAVAGASGAEVYRVTTVSPFPRGLQVVDGDLYVLSRGRVRSSGGVSADVQDQAGTLYKVDPSVAQPLSKAAVSDAVRANGEVFALPTSPPFHLWDTAASPPHEDRVTDRPYCGLRWHGPSQSFYICAFSGVDKPGGGSGRSFSKNLTDAILRYNTRTKAWSEVERHDIEAGGIYPHNDPRTDPPPHGLVNGPDNLLPLGNWLYVVAKDNSVLVRYDLTPYIGDPAAGPARGEHVLGSAVTTANAGPIGFLGHSALAHHDGWLYIASRTSSHIIRMKVDGQGDPAEPREIELVARFDPWTRENPQPADLTDMAFDSKGRLYVVSAQPSRIFRFTPDPAGIYDARDGARQPYLDLAGITGNPKMKSENVLVEGNALYVTSGDGYDFQYGAEGTVYRADIID